MRTLLAVLLVSALAAPAALASTRADRVAAADAFARRSLGLARQLEAADKRATASREARRAAAQPCADTFRTAPLARQDELKDVYFWYLSGGLWKVDAPIYGSWIADLRRSKRIDRSPVLARAADSLRRDYRIADFVYTAVPDACAMVTAWRDAGWSDAARPAVFAASEDMFGPSNDRVQAEAAAQIRRYARLEVYIGIDEVDARVHATKGCDAVGKLLFPDEYRC